MDTRLIKQELATVLADARRLVGRSLDEMHAGAGSRRFTSAVASAAPHACVAFGIGRAPLPDWICTDITRNVQLYLDLTRPWPVPPAAVSHAYGDNVIEHFPLAIGREVLRNCHQALAPGGSLRLATPDLERAARAYLDGGELGRSHLECYADTDIVAEHPVDLIRMLFAYNDHWAGYLYDEAVLTDELTRAGFREIRRWEPGESDDPSFRGLESRTGATFQHFQLVLQASK